MTQWKQRRKKSVCDRGNDIWSTSANKTLWVIWGFRREVAENRTLLGYYAASSGNFLPLLAA
jgi:3-methyladenine DNA glycosylase AlkC